MKEVKTRSFLNLPLEIRNNIYYYVLCEPNIVLDPCTCDPRQNTPQTCTCERVCSRVYRPLRLSEALKKEGHKSKLGNLRGKFLAHLKGAKDCFDIHKVGCESQ